MQLNILAADRALRGARGLVAKAGLPDRTRAASDDPARAIVEVIQLSPVPVTVVK